MMQSGFAVSGSGCCFEKTGKLPAAVLRKLVKTCSCLPVFHFSCNFDKLAKSEKQNWIRFYPKRKCEKLGKAARQLFRRTKFIYDCVR